MIELTEVDRQFLEDLRSHTPQSSLDDTDDVYVPFKPYIPSQAWDEAAQSKFYAEQAAKKRELLAFFIQKNDMRADLYLAQDRKILILSSRSVDTHIPQQLLEAIATRNKLVDSRGISDNCYAIALEACNEAGFSGRMASKKGCKNFTRSGNHCINYQELDDGTILAFDLTTSENIDHHTRQFDVLALKSPTVSEALILLGDLYGGDWQLI